MSRELREIETWEAQGSFDEIITNLNKLAEEQTNNGELEYQKEEPEYIGEE